MVLCCPCSSSHCAVRVTDAVRREERGLVLPSSCWWWGEVSGAIFWGCLSLNCLSLVASQGSKRL